MSFFKSLDFDTPPPAPLAEPVSEAALFRTLWAAPSQAVAILSDLGMAEANERFEKFLAPSPGESLREVLLALFSAENHGFLQKVWSAEIDGFECEAVTRRGRSLRLNVMASGRRRALVLATDVSDLSALQEEIEEKLVELEVKNEALKKYIDGELQLENFAFLASHDLREPIRSINSFSQLLEKRCAPSLGETGLEYLDFIRKAAGQMDRLTLDLLHFSQISSQELRKEPFSIEKIADWASKRLEHDFPGVAFSVELDATAKAATVRADRALVAEAVYQIFHNGLKFRRPDVPPVLHLALADDGGFWRFSVSDNGIGIDAAFFDKIFLLLKRLHLRHEFAGSGTGLAVVRKIAERHGGRAWVESRVGSGSTFYFLIEK